MPWIKATSQQDLLANSKLCVEIENTSLLLIWWNGEAYAIKNQCSHAFKPLSDGEILNGIIQCPFHGARFCITSGEHLSPPAFKGIETFPTRSVDGYIEVKL